MVKESLGEICLERRESEFSKDFFTPDPEPEDEEDTGVDLTLNNAFVSEGQEALWVEDDANFRGASAGEKPAIKKKKKVSLFGGRKKKTQKAVLLLPPQPIDEEDIKNLMTQEKSLDQNPTTDSQAPIDKSPDQKNLDGQEEDKKDSKEERKDEEEEHRDDEEETQGAEEVCSTEVEPRKEVAQNELKLEAQEDEKEEREDDVEDLEDVVQGSIDIPEEILEEMKLNIEDAVEKVRKGLDSQTSNSAELPSLGLTTDPLEYEEEYGVEMNLPSSGKAVELVGTGTMMLEAETVEQVDDEDKSNASKAKRTKWGLLRIFKNKPKQQIVSAPSNKNTVSVKVHTNTVSVKVDTAAAEEEKSVSPNQLVSEPDKSASSATREADKYSVAPPQAALADNMEEEEDEDAEDDVAESHYLSGDDDEEEDDLDDRYRIVPQKKSKSEYLDDGNRNIPQSERKDSELAASTGKAMTPIPNRVGVKKPAVTPRMVFEELTEVIKKRVEPTSDDVDNQLYDDTNEIVENVHDVNESPELLVDERDEEENLVDDKAEKEEEADRDTSLNEVNVQSEQVTKRKNGFARIFAKRKMKNQKKNKGKKSESKPKAPIKSEKTESPSTSSKINEAPKVQSRAPSKTPNEHKNAQRSPVASIKGDSKTVIAAAVSKGALMAVESNLENEGNLISRRLRTRKPDSSRDVIDLIRERSEKKKNDKKQDPLDSLNTDIRMSMSKDPSGKAMFGSKKDKKDERLRMYSAPTPRAKKTVETVEEEPAEESFQHQITRRLYGTPKGNSHLMKSNKIYIGDLLQGVSTDPTVDSVVSNEKESNEIVAAK